MLYLDNAATTKPDLDSVNKAFNFLNTDYYNPSALYHNGINVSKEIKIAKEYILSTLRSTCHEITFTSCGSEADNLAIFGSVKRGTFVTDMGEHAAVYNAFKELQNKGNAIYFVPLNKDGTVNTEKLFEYVKNNKTDFVSIMHVNNETGAINDINYIAKELKKINPKIIFMSDGVQAYGKLDYAISQDIDFYTISAHKIGGLKGTGALLHKKGINLSPIIFGGGQENGIRSGTENVFGIKVFEYSARKKYANIIDNFNKVKELNNLFRNNLSNDFLIISSEMASPYILSIAFTKVRGEVIMHNLDDKGIIVGNGSACSSKKPFSRIIESCGIDKKYLNGVIRISFNSLNTSEEILDACKVINQEVAKGKEIFG